MGDDAKSKPGKKTNKASEAPAETVPTSSGGFVWLVVFLVIIGVGGWAFWPEIGPSVKPIIAKVRGISKPEDMAPVMVSPAPKASVAPVVVSAEPPKPSPAPAPAPTAEVANNTANTASALANIQNRLGAIERRLAELENRPQLTRDPTSSAQVLVLATTQLAARLGGEGPFVAELDVLEKVSGQSKTVIEAVKELRPHADAGIPTIATLRTRLADLSKGIMRARLGDGESGWMGEIKDKLGSLVTIRRTDPATTTDPVERALALASAALAVGALDEAVQAISAIEGNAGSVAAPWLGDAGARLLAQSTLETLNNYALSQLGGEKN